MASPSKVIDEAVRAAKKEDYLRGLTLFLEVFGSEDAPTLTSPKDASALSYFGLCVALMKREYKGAIDLCKRAISLEFYNGDHYANLTKVYTAAGNRKKAIETVEAGLKLLPEHPGLLAVRNQLGVRARPTVPFLDRNHPVNVSLGQARHAKQVADREKRRGK
jgi:tetratricopeptide (TPR) repeat protein